MIKEALSALVSGRSLTSSEAAAVMTEIMEGQATPAQIGAFVTALRMKGETPDEIAGMARVMREKSLRVHAQGPLVDTCGTGGDGAGTFNISTAAAFVVAGAGLKVAKHGNRAASGSCGSADVLEACGVKIDLGPQGVERCLEEVGIGFMFAPAFHPAMKHVAGPRRELGIRTVFNILGPLTNPAGAQSQVIGVADANLGDKMARVLDLLGSSRAMVVHSEDGLDEISLSEKTRVWELNYGVIHSYDIFPSKLGFTTIPLQALKGGSPEANVALLKSALKGEEGPALDVVLLNASAALVVGGKARDLREGVDMARKAVASSEATKKLERLIEVSQKAAQA